MPFAAALSAHPVPAHAVGEALGQIVETLAGVRPDVAVVFVSAAHVGAVEDIASSINSVLQPRCLVGTTGSGIVGGSLGIEDSPALAVWAGALNGQVAAVRLTAEPTESGWHVEGMPTDTGDWRTLVLLADPYTFPSDALLDGLRLQSPHLAVIGGMASAARGPGGNRLVFGNEIVTHGAVGFLLDADASPDTVVSQGCRPIGQPWIVTRAERNIIYELAGRPALERLMEIIDHLSPDDRRLAAAGLHCGIVVDERKVDFERGDFLIRGVLGADKEAGAVAIGDEMPVGSTVQFQVRDAATAGEDLISMLTGRDADGALVFTCNGRGEFMFGTSSHDAEIVHEVLDAPAAAGMFCAGELGPVGDRNAVHGFTASIALFRDRPQPDS